MDDGAILELDGHRLVVQLHQEPTKAQSPTKSAPIRARLHQTDQRSEANRGKREPTEDAGLPDKLHLGGAWWDDGAEVKARVFAGGAAASS